MSEKKTVTVTDVHGRQARLVAIKVDEGSGIGELAVHHDAETVTVFAAGQWVSAVHDEHRAPDGTSRALDIARRNLRAMLDDFKRIAPVEFPADDKPTALALEVLTEVRRLAMETLEEIFAETEA